MRAWEWEGMGEADNGVVEWWRMVEDRDEGGGVVGNG